MGPMHKFRAVFTAGHVAPRVPATCADDSPSSLKNVVLSLTQSDSVSFT